MRLQHALEMMSPAAREALRSRRAIKLDPRKRLDELEQTARGLIAETDLRHSKFPTEVRQLLHRLVSVGGVLPGGATEPGAALLCELGVAYRPGVDGAVSKGAAKTGRRVAAGTLVLPSAFLLQVPVGEGEDPACLRACLSMVDPELVGPMVSTVVGKPLGVSGPLALQEAWEVFSGAGYLEQAIKDLPAAEARLLDALERVGGEVNTEELLALDQAPGLYRTQSGIAVPKRGAPFMLQRRGMLFQLGVERFVVPSEVARIVGATRQKERAWRRAELRSTISEEDHAPRRARYARDPSLTAVAVLSMLRAWEIPVRPDVGVARASLRRAAERLGEPEETVTLLAALARAAGLARLAAPLATVSGSLRSVRAADVGEVLWATYVQGGAWDESRAEPEVLRSGLAARGTTAASLARRLLLEALDDLARDRWVSVDALLKDVAEDSRAVAARRLHERAMRERPEVYRGTIEDALRTMLTRSLPALGAVDVAEDGSAVRLVRRSSPGPTEVAATVSRHAVEVPSQVELARVMALADVGEPERIRPEGDALVFSLGVAALARARARSLTSAQVEERLRGVGLTTPFPAAVTEILRGLSASREAGYLPAGGVVVVDDPELVAELRADPSVRRMLLDVEAGNVLILRAGVEVSRLHTRLARLGVRVLELNPGEPEPDLHHETPPHGSPRLAASRG